MGTSSAETKGREELDLPQKMARLRLRQWCEDATAAIRDDGSPANLVVSDQLLLTLADMKSDGRIVPQPTLTVERRRLKGADYE